MAISANCASDTSALELQPLQRLLLWAIRTWSAYHDDPTAVWWSLDRAFSEAGIRPALAPFGQMMSALCAGWKRWPSIACVRCPRVSADERELLLLLDQLCESVTRRRTQRAARQRLRQMVIEPSADVACAAAIELVTVIVGAGLDIVVSNQVKNSAEVANNGVPETVYH